MYPDHIRALVDRRNAGEILSVEEIRQLMNYALGLMREFGELTDKSIAAIKKVLDERGIMY